MQAADEKLGDVFSSRDRFEVPIFQRPYVWNEDRNWVPLWDDLRSAAELVEARTNDDGPARELFLGAFVTQHQDPAPKRVPVKVVIDGQQRMTTLQVALAAAHRVAEELAATDAADSFATLLRNRVARDTEHPKDAYKVTPLPADRVAFEWAVRLAGEKSICLAPEHQLVKAAAWFEDTIRSWALEADDPADRLDILHFAVSERVKVVSIFLDARDDPQVIFESLNDKGERLAAADLVKNLLFQRLTAQGDQALEHALHEEHWKPLDEAGWRTKVTTGRITRARVDTLLAYWLSAQVGDLVSVEHLYATFKGWLTRTTPAPAARDVIVDVRRWADTMDELLARPMSDPVRQVVDRLEATGTTTPWPVLLALHARDGVPQQQAQLGAAALDSYLMRRAMCQMTAKDYNRLFGSLLGTLAQCDPAVAGTVVVTELARQTADARVWPDDSMFVHALAADDVFNRVTRARLKSLLVGLDTALITSRGERDEPLAATAPLTIEHVLPREWSTHWPLRSDLDEQTATDVREGSVHSLGNLTLATSSLNSEMRNGPWRTKRQALMKHSLLRLTSATIMTQPAGMTEWTAETWPLAWDEARISERTMWLAHLARETWPGPETFTAQ